FVECAGINRRGVVHERVMQERSSDPSWPESCVASREAAIEALTGVHAGGGQPPAEGTEGRQPTKENIGQATAPGTQSRIPALLPTRYLQHIRKGDTNQVLTTASNFPFAIPVRW